MAIEYLNNKVFEAIIERYRKTKEDNSPDHDNAKLDLATAFYTLAKNIIRAFKFQMVDNDDALQEGVMICFDKLHRFDPKIGRAFNFCTTIILNHYRQLYRAAKNYNELKMRYHNHLCDKSNEPYLNSGRVKKNKPSRIVKEEE